MQLDALNEFVKLDQAETDTDAGAEETTNEFVEVYQFSYACAVHPKNRRNFVEGGDDDQVEEAETDQDRPRECPTPDAGVLHPLDQGLEEQSNQSPISSENGSAADVHQRKSADA